MVLPFDDLKTMTYDLGSWLSLYHQNCLLFMMQALIRVRMVIALYSSKKISKILVRDNWGKTKQVGLNS